MYILRVTSTPVYNIPHIWRQQDNSTFDLPLSSCVRNLILTHSFVVDFYLDIFFRHPLWRLGQCNTVVTPLWNVMAKCFWSRPITPPKWFDEQHGFAPNDNWYFPLDGYGSKRDTPRGASPIDVWLGSHQKAPTKSWCDVYRNTRSASHPCIHEGFRDDLLTLRSY